MENSNKSIENCPCGSNKKYTECCEIFIKGNTSVETAEQLLRSRFSAYVKREIEYIVNTTLPQQQIKLDKKAIRDWAEKTNWTKVEIIKCFEGSKNDDSGTVEFVAYYKDKGLLCKHHEVGKFKKVDTLWYYDDSEFPKAKQVTRSEPKIKRNDPCPCGSGKKYKKCCGR